MLTSEIDQVAQRTTHFAFIDLHGLVTAGRENLCPIRTEDCFGDALTVPPQLRDHVTSARVPYSCRFIFAGCYNESAVRAKGSGCDRTPMATKFGNQCTVCGIPD